MSGLSHSGLAAYIRLHAVGIDEQLHAKIAVDLRLACRLGEPTHAS